MSEIKKLTIVGIIIAVLLALLTTTYILDKKGVNLNNNNNSNSNNSGYELYYLGREGCGYCQLFQPNIDYIKEKYNLNYNYIDISTLTNEELNNYLEKFNIDSNNFGTPTVVIMKNDKYVANHIGLMSSLELFDFLKENNVLTGEYIYPYSNINYIDLDGYKKIVDSNDKKLLVIAQDGCNDCDLAQEYLSNLGKNGLEVNWYNASFETEEDFNYFSNSYEYIKNALEKDELYVPTFMIVENKKVIDVLSQYTSEDDLKNLLTTNGLIK